MIQGQRAGKIGVDGNEGDVMWKNSRIEFEKGKPWIGAEPHTHSNNQIPMYL